MLNYSLTNQNTITAEATAQPIRENEPQPHISSRCHRSEHIAIARRKSGPLFYLFYSILLKP